MYQLNFEHIYGKQVRLSDFINKVNEVDALKFEQTKWRKDMLAKMKQLEEYFEIERLNWQNERTTFVQEIQDHKTIQNKAMELLESQLKLIEQKVGPSIASSDDLVRTQIDIYMGSEQGDMGNSTRIEYFNILLFVSF